MREDVEQGMGRQTLEIVGVMEKRGVWNERVNLQRNRLASLFPCPSKQSTNSALSGTHAHAHTHTHT